MELPETTISATLSATASGFSSAGPIENALNVRLIGFYPVEGDTRSFILSSPSFFDATGRNWRKDGDPGVSLYPTENKPGVVDSAVGFSQMPAFNGQFYGGGSFSVDARNFITPSYNLGYHWSWIGDGDPDSTASSELAATRSNITLPVSGPAGSNQQAPGFVWFGADREGFPKHSTVKVTATDSDGVKAEDSMSITWHLPLENVQPDYESADISDIRYQTASPWVVLNTPVTVTLSSPSVWWGIAGGGSTVLSAGAAFLPPPFDIVVPLALAGASVGITSATPPTVQYTTPFSYDWYAQAVRRQRDINNRASGTQYDYQRVYPPELADLAYPTLTDAGHAQNDSYWSQNQTSMQGQVLIAWHWTQRSYTGELYNQSGFAGRTRYPITKDDSFDYVYLVRKPANGGGS